jgi:hypothetical protein
MKWRPLKPALRLDREEVRINRSDAVRLGDIAGVRYIDAGGAGWLEVATTQGQILQTELTTVRDPLCPVDPLALMRKLELDLGISIPVWSLASIKKNWKFN